MKQTETITAYYDGKKKGKSGTKNGKDWKMYKVEAKLRPDSTYTTKLTMFDSAQGLDLLTEDNEGELLTFKCDVSGYTHKEYGQQISRLIQEVTAPEMDVPTDKIMTKDEFYNSTTDETTTETTVKQEPVVQEQGISQLIKDEPQQIVPEATLEVFKGNYKKAIPELDRSYEHFVILYMKVLAKYNCVNLFLQHDSKALTKMLKEAYETFMDKDLGEVL